MGTLIRKAAGVIICCSLFFTPSLQAQDDKAAAKTAFAEGKTYFENGDYAKAAASFRWAYSLSPNWKLQYNIAQAEAAANHPDLALEAFELYLSEAGDQIDTERIDEVLAEIDRFRKMVGYLEVKCPSGLLISVDGVFRGACPISQLITISAKVSHTVTASQNGEMKFEETTMAPGGQKVTVDFSQAKQPAAAATVVSGQEAAMPPPEGDKSGAAEAGVSANAAPPKSDSARDESKAKKLRKAGWVTMGIGAVALIMGGVTGGMAMSADKDLEEACPDGCYTDQYDEMRRRDALALSSDILFGVGGAAAVTGLVMVIVGHKKSSKETAHVELFPTVASDRAGATLQWRF